MNLPMRQKEYEKETNFVMGVGAGLFDGISVYGGYYMGQNTYGVIVAQQSSAKHVAAVVFEERMGDLNSCMSRAEEVALDVKSNTGKYRLTDEQCECLRKGKQAAEL